MIERMDDLGRTLRLEGSPQRIVCLVPSITETLFAVGAGKRIAGITDYCIHPREGVAGKERVGGTKNILVERIISLQPDLVIANVEENRKHQIEALERAGLRVFVTFPKTVAGCLKMIRDVAILAEAEPAAEPILASIEAERFLARALPKERTCRVLCPIWKNPYMSINQDTFVDSIIRESGGINIFAESAERYPRFTLEDALGRQPDVIILPTEPYHFTHDDIEDFQESGANTPAVRNRRIHIVEGELVSWYGPRVARALRELSALFFS